MAHYSYEEVIEKIEHARRFGNLPGVTVAGKMLDVLGNPQKGLPFVHIAGTNGKGSTAAFLSSILQQAGKKTGMFTSPHLIDFRERIVIKQMGGKEERISKEAVIRLGSQLLERDFGVTPTMFDYCLLLAVLYFKEQGCDIAVMETGLGGRLDSTNALGIPRAVLITKIGFDHMDILGSSLSEIASEKAGIIKPQVPVVWERQEPEAEQVFVQASQRLGAAYRSITEEEIADIRNLPRKMQGEYQLENAALAAAGAKILMRQWRLPELLAQKAIRDGIAKAHWAGRMEVLSKDPLFLVDGAHNGHGVRAFSDSLKKLYPGKKFHFLMGVLADKDYENMIEELLPLALDFQTVTPESSRALQAEELAETIAEKHIPASYVPNLKRALAERLPDTAAFGSLYFIGEVEALFQKEHAAYKSPAQWSYDKKEKNGRIYLEITGRSRIGSVLEIPEDMEELSAQGGSGHRIPVESIGGHAFAGNDRIREIILPKTIRELHPYAFYNCIRLQKLSLYDSVEDYYDGIIKQCRSLSEITITFERNSFSVLKELLADNDRTLHFILRFPKGKEGEKEIHLTFPAYVYDFVEDVEARVLHHKIEGAGYPYRECVTRRGIDYHAYDSLFTQASHEDFVTAAAIVFDRLCYPYELNSPAKEYYENFLQKNAGRVLSYLIREEKTEEIRYLTARRLIPNEVLDEALLLAAERKASCISAELMEYRREHFAGQTRPKQFTL